MTSSGVGRTREESLLRRVVAVLEWCHVLGLIAVGQTCFASPELLQSAHLPVFFVLACLAAACGYAILERREVSSAARPLSSWRTVGALALLFAGWPMVAILAALEGSGPAS